MNLSSWNPNPCLIFCPTDSSHTCFGQWKINKQYTNTCLKGTCPLGCAFFLAAQVQARLVYTCGSAESQYQLPDMWVRLSGTTSWLQIHECSQSTRSRKKPQNNLLINGGLRVFCYSAKANWYSISPPMKSFLNHSFGWKSSSISLIY